MIKRQFIFWSGAVVIAMGISAYLHISKKHHDEIVDCLREDLDYLQTKLNKKNEEMSVLENINKETELAIEIFCDKNVADMIHELVNARLTIQRMRKNGASEEEITEKMIHSPTPDMIKSKHICKNLGYSDSVPVDISEDPKDDPEVNFEEVVPNPDLPNVHLITEDEFCTEDGYDKVVITYFAGDDTLCDSDDDILDQGVMEMTDLLCEFSNTDCPSLFIRNERMAIDYEVLWDDNSYQTVVLGVSGANAVLLPRIFRKKE